MRLITPQNKSDLVSKGVITGFVLPIIGMILFILIAGNRFETYKEAVLHFQAYGILYKALSLAMMPSAGLFFLWTNTDRINMARGILLVTMFYGVFVLILFMT